MLCGCVSCQALTDGSGHVHRRSIKHEPHVGSQRGPASGIAQKAEYPRIARGLWSKAACDRENVLNERKEVDREPLHSICDCPPVRRAAADDGDADVRRGKSMCAALLRAGKRLPPRHQGQPELWRRAHPLPPGLPRAALAMAKHRYPSRRRNSSYPKLLTTS